jgi:hypothetical protein
MTLKRVRRYALLAGIALWTVFAADYATPGPLDRLGKIKGTDFVQFYASGSLVFGGHADRLYDNEALLAAIRSAVPQERETIYVPIQSPQLSFLFAPLSAVPYTAALVVWLTIIVGMYAAVCVMLWSRCTHLRAYRREVIGCAAAFPGLYATVIHGQVSVFALVSITYAFVALERRRALAAGMALGCLTFKPHWVIAAGAVFLLAREWRILAGMAASALLQLGATIAVAGPRVFLGYLSTLESIGRLGDILEPRPGYALRSFFSVFVPSPQAAFVLYLLAAAFVAIVAARTWRTAASFEVRASALVLAIVLVAPHVFEYDLITLTPVFFLVANAMAAGLPTGLADARWTWVLAALFAAPVLTAVPPAIRLQFSTTAMAAILVRMSFVARADRSAEARLEPALIRG